MNDIKHFFPPVSGAILRQLRLTEEGRYSITRPNHGRQIANIIREYIPDSAEFNFVDGTAGMGGDLYYISPLFKHVIGVEKNPEHAEIAKSNLAVLGRTNATIINQSIIDYLSTNKDIDVLWLDPPWGGPDYKNHKELDLYLDDTNVAELVGQLLDNKYVKVVFLKTPTNYKLELINKLKYSNKVFEIKSHDITKFLIIMIW